MQTASLVLNAILEFMKFSIEGASGGHDIDSKLCEEWATCIYEMPNNFVYIHPMKLFWLALAISYFDLLRRLLY